ncbi:MAG: SDR family oxidoreductase [Sediminibacterium sp.]|nr:SDR family oxidoreductase [Sediminibacterium sp.]
MSTFTNKVVVITGGSDGIGKAMVDLFLLQGAKVATCARKQEKLYALQTENAGKPLHICQADVSIEADCEKFIQSTLEAFGTIDILINNAGISMRALFIDTLPATIKKVMDVNFMGTVYCTHYALPHIIQNKGIIVGISSIAGFRGLPGRSGYSASKFALNGWLESLRTELLHSGVQVLTACPGFTTSNIRVAALNSAGEAQGETPMDESAMMSSTECAKHIMDAMNNKKRTLVLTFNGKRTVFLNKFLPALTDKLVRNFFYKNDQLVK